MFFKVSIFILATLLSVSGVFAEQSGATNFSAEMVMKAEGQIMQGKLYVSNSKSRMETQVGVIIARPDKNVSLILMPEQKMYMEQPIDLKRVPKTSKELPGETERTLIGTEAVEGKTAKKFKITYTENGRQESLYQWLADGVPVPVKMETLDGSWSMEYRNINVGFQPDSLFEPPANYQKFAVPNMAAMGQALSNERQ